MNTTQLQSAHPDTYKEFFDSYDLVISVPICFEMVWLLSRKTKWGPIICFKLPLRNYIGYNSSHLPTNDQIPFTYKNNTVSDFVSGTLSPTYDHDRYFFSTLWLPGEIGYFSEYNWYDSPTIISLAITAKLLTSKTLTSHDISQLTIHNDEYAHVLSYYMKELQTHRSLIQQYSYNNIYHMWIIGTSLLTSDQFLYYEDEHNNNTSFSPIHIPWSLRIPKLGCTILSLTWTTVSPYKALNVDHINSDIDSFAHEHQFAYDNNYIDAIANMEKYFSLKLVQSLEHLLNDHPQWYTFFSTIKDYNLTRRWLSHRDDFLWIQKNQIDHIMGSQITWGIHHNKRMGMEIWWTKTIIWNKRTIPVTQQQMNEIHKQTWYEFMIDYSSHEDGYEIDGVKIEQRKSQWILHPHHTWTTQKNTIIINTIEKKLYINGKKLTSDHLRSQSQTVELLQSLLPHQGKKIVNSSLPPSSYTKNKNQMISKIVSPLKNIIFQQLKRDIVFECRWSLYEYRILLDMQWIEIEIV